MRRFRFTCVLLLAWLLAGQGMVGAALAAQRIAAPHAGSLCLDPNPQGLPSDAGCAEHCLGLVTGIDTPPPTLAARAERISPVATSHRPQAASPPARFAGSASPRGPPAPV